MTETVILGGGQTGRGFIGRLLYESGIPFVFLDKNPNLINALNQKGSYSISFFSSKNPIRVNDIEAYYAYSPQASEAIQNAKNIFISVGSENLEAAARYLLENKVCAKNIILCENAITPSRVVHDIFKKEINISAVNFVDTAIFCTTIKARNDPADILSEEYHKLPFDAGKVKNPFFKAPFFEPELNFPLLLMRKLCTYNAASAIITYVGWNLGYSILAEAASDPTIQMLLRNYYSAINNAICSKYGISSDIQREFAKNSLKKFSNPNIVDSIERNARQPLKKLGPDERIAFPMKLLLENNFNTQPLCKTAAAAILYGEQNESDWVKRFGIGQAGMVFSMISKINDKSMTEMINYEYGNLKKI
ncbi:MAG TPA: 2-dehydropantoate 2-reductase N-terminal domain-containing protein [Oscillospiraceae bacterium]|nr:2-dehydropantoate 2-reductase N-terminal domain-containing protein [Oscillospiraceae bacterium]HPF56158.1 2-dehydropantoate 2-reductase N-terminal domain-containing protein [Clostridiales bacterium]HPK35587.1 2-dehydropantoate 2-reductase N-terminal domain-containing protein [Oscillospiraceae bacterium]HPR75876.1 2-dehydropantoate 2-reductase N-terminal domain-containing protein [Oscillospiraceae bacterium]